MTDPYPFSCRSASGQSQDSICSDGSWVVTVKTASPAAVSSSLHVTVSWHFSWTARTKFLTLRAALGSQDALASRTKS